MKKIAFSLVCVLLAALVLVGCGGSKEEEKAPDTQSVVVRPSGQSTAAPARSSEFDVTFYNATDYNFHEIYISSTASDEWGSDYLGSTNLLKKNGSFTISVPAYDFENYDVMVVDEDDDVYQFQYVTLTAGCELFISWEEDGIYATVSHPNGDSEMIAGASTVGGSGGEAPAQTATATGTGNDTNGAYSFTVYNETPYDIYAIYMGVTGASADQDLDILPAVLSGGSSTEVSGLASSGDWMNTEWTLYIVDVDGDVSQTFDVFNPWTVSYVDIYWDSENGGYYCDFVY